MRLSLRNFFRFPRPPARDIVQNRHRLIQLRNRDQAPPSLEVTCQHSEKIRSPSACLNSDLSQTATLESQCLDDTVTVTAVGRTQRMCFCRLSTTSSNYCRAAPWSQYGCTSSLTRGLRVKSRYGDSRLAPESYTSLTDGCRDSTSI